MPVRSAGALLLLVLFTAVACDLGQFNDSAPGPAKLESLIVPDSAARADTLKVAYSWSYTACEENPRNQVYLNQGPPGRPLWLTLSIAPTVKSRTQPAAGCSDTKYVKLDSILIPPTRDTLFTVIFYGSAGTVTKLERDYPKVSLSAGR